MSRLNTDRQAELEPQRRDVAKRAITELGFTIIIENDVKIVFYYNRSPVHFYPYSGWHTGKSIVDGRGLRNLIKQIKN